MSLILRQYAWLKFLLLFAMLFSCLLISGCSGCRNKTDDEITAKEKEEKKKKEKEKKKPDFANRSPILLPGWFPKEQKKNNKDVPENDSAAPVLTSRGNPALRFNRAKLGHWVESSFQAIANNFNADGQLSCHSIEGLGDPVAIPSTDYFLTTTRPASLPKGEWKNFETSVFLPCRNTKASIANVIYSLDRSAGGLVQIMATQPTSLLKPFQHHIVLLSDRPDSYNFLKMADSIQLHGQRMASGNVVPPFYYIVPTIPGDPLPLPRHTLHWTTIAYLIWDDFDPDRLSADHQSALLDWLHFGGQLILSGPDCLDKLQHSFLTDYLPAQFAGSRNITNKDLTELNKNWTVPVVKNDAEKRVFQVSEAVPLLGVEFKPHVDAEFVNGTGEMAIERQIGRGRIVITSFSLSAPVVRKWRSFPSFLNNALLRRMPREFARTDPLEVFFAWENDDTPVFDPLAGTTLRFLSRDLGRQPNEQPDDSLYAEYHEKIAAQVEYIVGGNSKYGQKIPRQQMAVRNKENHWHFGGYSDARQSGVGGWNDDSGVSVAARETLKEAAGITPPSSTFVLKMLGAYLIVLVPLNWIVFRLLGRVEWAWIAAPFIAIAGAVLVVKMASLDIGFIRSNTQIGLLEIHADYPRAHATEYSALYTSLSTRYDVDLDNATAQSLPFARVDAKLFHRSAESLSQVKLKRTVQNRLEGFQIQSNSTGLLHTEFMLDLEGTVSCDFNLAGQPEFVTNGSVLDLKHAGVLWRDVEGQIQIAWIGDLNGRSATEKLKFESIPENQSADRWRELPLFASSIRLADQIWNKHVGAEVQKSNLSQLSEIPEIANDWNTYQPLFLRNVALDESSSEFQVTRSEFQTVFQSVNVYSSIQIGRLFDAVADVLQLSPGECRMIASTDQRLGRTKFDPDATQTDQQTLAIVHLKRPPLPIAKRDVNALTDFTGRSDLDWEREMEELEEQFDE